MAEIKIVKKQPVWPWILLALGAAVLIYYFFFRDKEAEQEIKEEVKDETSMIPKSQSNSQNTYDLSKSKTIYS